MEFGGRRAGGREREPGARKNAFLPGLCKAAEGDLQGLGLRGGANSVSSLHIAEAMGEKGHGVTRQKKTAC